MDEPWKNIITEIDKDGIATLTINREEKLNALNIETLEEIDEVFSLLLRDEKVKGVILTGAGEKAFAAGADISELKKLDEESGRALSLKGQRIFSRIESSSKPVVAVVNGYALGGGAELAMACHLRIASENAVFGLPEVSLGLIPGFGGTQRLPRLIGHSLALEFILTGKQMKAKQAEKTGLVSRLEKRDRVMEAAKDLLKEMVRNGPAAVARAISAVNMSGTGNGFSTEAELFGELCGTDDAKEGTSAFLEKRKPEFIGK